MDRIITLANTGAIERFTNACLWISILDYLKITGIVDRSFTVDNLRRDAGFTESDNTDFDFENLNHTRALKRVLNRYNLRLVLHVPRREGTREINFGNERNINVVHIYGGNAYGGPGHFELIVHNNQIDLRQNMERINRPVSEKLIGKMETKPYHSSKMSGLTFQDQQESIIIQGTLLNNEKIGIISHLLREEEHKEIINQLSTSLKETINRNRIIIQELTEKRNVSRESPDGIPIEIINESITQEIERNLKINKSLEEEQKMYEQTINKSNETIKVLRVALEDINNELKVIDLAKDGGTKYKIKYNEQ